MQELTEREYLLKAQFRALIKALGGYEAAASHVRVSHQTLHSYGNPSHPDSFPRVDVVMRLEQELRVAKPVTSVLNEDGPRPPLDIDTQAILKMAARAQEDLGKFGGTAHEAAEDGQLSKAERHELIKASERLLSTARGIHDDLHRYDIACHAGLKAVGES